MDSMINSSFKANDPTPIDILVSGESSGKLLFNIYGNFTIADLPFPPKLEVSKIALRLVVLHN